MGRAPSTPCSFPPQKQQDPVPHPRSSSCCPIAPCSATKPQGQARFWLRAGAPLQHPRLLGTPSTRGWGGQEQIEAQTQLVPITPVPGSRVTRLDRRWADAGLAWPHPAQLSTRGPLRAWGHIPGRAGPVPRRPRHGKGQVPSIWCPWLAPSAGAGALIWAT